MLFLMLLAISWEYRTSAPAARTYPAIGEMTATNSSGHACVYAIGGATILSQVQTNYEYDCVANSWITRAQMPAPARYDFAGCRAFRAGVERLYVIGGYQSVFVYLTDVDEYTPSTNTWTSRADMPTQREGVRAAVVSNMVYAIGGDYFDDIYYVDYVYNIVERYDPETNAWTIGYAAMPTARTDACCAVAVNEYGDSCIYVFGGSTSIIAYEATNAVEEYDPGSDAWRVRSSNGFTARGGAMAVADRNNLIYVVGGTTDGSSSTGLVQVYDPIANTWSSETPINTARDGATGGMAGDIGGRIHVVVGSTGATPVTTNERSAEIVSVGEGFTNGMTSGLHIRDNPFRSSTEVRFCVSSTAHVRLQLYDVQGSHIQTVVNRVLQAGEYALRIGGTTFSSGVYFLRFDAGEYRETRKVILLE